MENFGEGTFHLEYERETNKRLPWVGNRNSLFKSCCKTFLNVEQTLGCYSYYESVSVLKSSSTLWSMPRFLRSVRLVLHSITTVKKEGNQASHGVQTIPS